MTSKMAIWIDCFFMAATRNEEEKARRKGAARRSVTGRGTERRARTLHCNGVQGGVNTAPRHARSDGDGPRGCRL